ncbi:unnamed protein product [Caenorhabditis bovis]|uniref:non-specific serine/threonine protein kinase n=1 Tax=Caenorhabditis bovis TaxID=2654633 RepID=A0A8S1EML2_9PELO|nr:unnamed protein product [Caenorhabditis bovis]
MPQAWRPSMSSTPSGIGGNTLPRAAKRQSNSAKSNIPRFKRPNLPHHPNRPHSAVYSTFSKIHRSAATATSSLVAVDDLTTPRASTFQINRAGVDGMSNGTSTAEGSMSSSMVMDSSEPRDDSPTETTESRDMAMEMQNRCRIGSTGFPHLVKAKRLRFYRNGDQYFKGISYALQSDRVKSMQPLMEDLVKTVLSDSTSLPHGIRYIFTIDGSQKITNINQFEDGGAYVCSSTDVFKQVDYARAGEPSWRLTLANRYNRHLETKKLALSVVEPSNERTDFVFPRIIKVIRNGVKPRKIIRHLLNKKTARSFDQVLRDLTVSVKLDSGAIRKLFGVSGRQVLTLEDFFREDDVFVAYGGNEKMAADDLLVASEEHKSVLSVLPRYKNTNRRRMMPSRNESLRLDRSGSVIPDEDAQRLPPSLDEQFELIRLIGDGNTAVVYEVADKRTKERRAMKVIAHENVVGQEHLIESELKILRKIENDFIVQLYDVWIVDNAYYLSLELIELGDLFEHLRRVKRVSERDAVRIMSCLGQALEYIHNMKIVHRDVKLENLLVVAIGIKLADFGLATEMPEDFQQLTAICGTPTYVAPEVLNQTGYGPKIDIWAAGVVLYAILVGFPPFQSSDGTEQDLFASIQSGEFGFPSPAWDGISWSVRHLITCLITLDPFDRYSATELIHDEWVENLCDVDPEYEEWAQMILCRKIRLNEEEETPYEYYTSRRTSMDELSETGREFSFTRSYS